MRLGAPFPRHNIASFPSPTPIAVAVAAFFTAPPPISTSRALPTAAPSQSSYCLWLTSRKPSPTPLRSPRPKLAISATAVPNERPLDLTEDNVRQALADARVELAQIFDASVGITGVIELVELDGPFVKISLKGRFWHKRSTVVARVGNYLKQRIPEILEVEIEDESQLDDSPASF